VNVVFGGRIVLEEADFEQEVRVVFFTGGVKDGAVGAAVAVEGRDGGHAAAASIGENKVAKVVMFRQKPQVPQVFQPPP
jgi:hypothetical protein